MAIADKLTQLNTIKGDIKAAIIAKGGTATDDMTTYATAISNLPSGGGDEVLRDLIEGDISGSFTIPSGTTKIGNYTFSGCTGLTSVIVPNSVTYIGNYAFENCTGLTSVTIPNSVTTIGQNTFSGCTGLTSVIIPNSVTSFGSYAFSGCHGLTSVTISTSVTKISMFAFSGCTNLPSITIPDSVTTIEQRVFNNCSSLMSITCLATTPPTIGNANAFSSVPATCAIYVPAESVETYKAANIWSTRASYIQAIPTS